jgi:hypothetical protein
MMKAMIELFMKN